MYVVPDLLKPHERAGLSSKTAIVDGPRRVTYDQLLGESLSWATALREAGLGKGERVAIYMRRSADAVVALFATYLAGGVAVILGDMLRPRQVRYILDHSEASLFVTEKRQLARFQDPVLPQRRILTVEEARLPRRPCSPEPLIGADLALLIYTSGSTGQPKGVMVSHTNLISGAQIVADYLHLAAQDVIISLLPFSFDYGLNQVLTTFLVGGTLVIQRSMFPPDICRTLQKESVTVMAGVPTLWLQVVGPHSPFTRMSLPHLRLITNSGGGLPEHVVRVVRKSHPHVRLYLMYGLTEAFRSTYLPHEEVDARPSSIGKAIPNVEILLLHEEGRLSEAGEVGELVHRGANVTLGYWRDPESTARVYRLHPFPQRAGGERELVVFSGDLVKKDRDAYLYFVGRRDQLIKSNGFRVSPEEVESWIFSSELVQGVIAVGVPGDYGDDQIVAAVIPKEPATFSEQLLHEFCRKEMPEYLRPRSIWRMEEFPQTASGKPDRVRIKEACVERHQRS